MTGIARIADVGDVHVSRGTTEIATIADAADFAALDGQWDALVQAMPRPSPFLLHGWLVEWWRHHGAGAALRVHVARREGRLVGALPLYVRSRAGVRVARFLGDEAAALGDLVLDERAERGTAARLAAWACRGGQDFADLFGLPAGSRLAAALPPGRMALVERVEAPVLDLDGGWEAAYRARTSAKRRNLHGRRRRALERLGRVEIVVARTLPELEPALEDAFRLHAARWRDLPEASGFATPVGRRFHRAALRALAPAGVPRIVLLRLDGRAIACNYFLLLGGRMYFHELAYDPAFAQHSPGLLATLAAIGAAAGEGARRVEFLGGAERYKLELADRCEPLHEGVGLAGTRRGRALAPGRVAAVRGRRRLKETGARRLYYDGLAPARRLARRAGP
jgi:CelD/BcsL family acetyltransferase involved in cellulose biosynthesis